LKKNGKKGILPALLITFGVICGVVILFTGLYLWDINHDPFRDRTEYPLAQVDVNDTSEYMLIKIYHDDTTTYEVVTDTREIKANASIFSIDNDGTLYGTTNSGELFLYKDGEHIGYTPFDDNFTKKIEYGTLRFKEVNELQYRLLLGYEIIEQDENYTVLCYMQSEIPYYRCFIHGEDLESMETVRFLASYEDAEKKHMPRKIGDEIIEFSAPRHTYAGEETEYWYFRRSDGALNFYPNVKAIRDNIVVFADYDSDGSRIVVCDMFDKAAYYKVINGDFSESERGLFLLSADFTADGTLRAEYIGKDGQVHSGVFSLE